jgi:hypothetical protein
MTALLLTCIIGQVALPYTGPVVIEPTFPADAVLHTTECGKTIGIVPEPPVSQPAYRTESYTAYVSTCGMGCCIAPITKQRRVPVGETTVNAPTPLAEIEEALRHIQLSKSDVLYDLGSGDGESAYWPPQSTAAVLWAWTSDRRLLSCPRETPV